MNKIKLFFKNIGVFFKNINTILTNCLDKVDVLLKAAWQNIKSAFGVF